MYTIGLFLLKWTAATLSFRPLVLVIGNPALLAAARRCCAVWCGCSSRTADGFFHGKSIYKWMRTRGYLGKTMP